MQAHVISAAQAASNGGSAQCHTVRSRAPHVPLSDVHGKGAQARLHDVQRAVQQWQQSKPSRRRQPRATPLLHGQPATSKGGSELDLPRTISPLPAAHPPRRPPSSPISKGTPEKMDPNIRKRYTVTTPNRDVGGRPSKSLVTTSQTKERWGLPYVPTVGVSPSTRRTVRLGRVR